MTDMKDFIKWVGVVVVFNIGLPWGILPSMFFGGLSFFLYKYL